MFYSNAKGKYNLFVYYFSFCNYAIFAKMIDIFHGVIMKQDGRALTGLSLIKIDHLSSCQIWRKRINHFCTEGVVKKKMDIFSRVQKATGTGFKMQNLETILPSFGYFLISPYFIYGKGRITLLIR